MDKFLNYTDNKDFVRWVLAPNTDLDKYWENYILNNPSEKEQIELARLLILQLQSKKENTPNAESVKIFSKIVQELETKNKKPTFRKIGKTILKYAAVALIFFSLGILYLYERQSEFDEISKQLASLPEQNDVKLILGDGKTVSIKEKKSEVDYKEDGNIVINKQDTVQATSKSKKIEMNQLVVPFGRNSSIKLPDGTVAYLNAGSKLVYPSRFKGKNRKVFLFGEGFFEVTHNADMPFIVTTKELAVEVLGTKFNISAYPSDKTVETVLVEGKVKLKETKFNILGRNYILKPNQQAVYSCINAKTKIRKVNVLNYVSWHQGYLNFESSALDKIAKKLERYYNIKIQFEKPLGAKTITGKLKLNEETDKVLQVLAETASAKLIKLNQSTYELK